MLTHCVGYWGQEQKTKEIMTKDGFLLTGDLGNLAPLSLSLSITLRFFLWFFPPLGSLSLFISKLGFLSSGTIDENGLCRIVGRSKDMIIRGGENIFPAEIENFLLKMNGVHDVACIGTDGEAEERRRMED